MPTYDYVCANCGNRFEVVHGVFAAGPDRCPVCQSTQVTKGFAPPTFHFKGTGWAKKDRGATARRAKAQDGEAAATSTRSDGATKSESGRSTGSAEAAASDSSSSEGGSRATSNGSDKPTKNQTETPARGSTAAAAD
jgi:putative FmdB family regulatory protein